MFQERGLPLERRGFSLGGGAFQKEEGWCAENFCLTRTPPPFWGGSPLFEGLTDIPRGVSLGDSESSQVDNPRLGMPRDIRWEPSSPPHKRSVKCVDTSLWPPYEAPSHPVCVHHVMILQEPSQGFL